MNLIKRGDEGDEVESLSDQLIQLGFVLGDKRHFNVYTEACVRIFQRTHKLTIDGLVGPRTRNEIDKASPYDDRVYPVKRLLDVPYFPQRDNTYVPWGTCNVTSLAMVLSYRGIQPEDPGKQLEDELFEILQTDEAREYFESTYPFLKKKGYNPRNIHGMLKWLAEEHYGLQDNFSLYHHLMHIEDEVVKYQRPVIVTGNFTASGHIIVVIGYTTDGNFIVHDPWGNWERGYRTGEGGEAAIYNYKDMKKILKPANRKHEKWAHFIEKE